MSALDWIDRRRPGFPQWYQAEICNNVGLSLYANDAGDWAIDVADVEVAEGTAADLEAAQAAAVQAAQELLCKALLALHPGTEIKIVATPHTCGAEAAVNLPRGQYSPEEE